MSNKKKYTITHFIFLCLFLIGTVFSSIDTRIAIGPSWRSFLSLEEYDVQGFPDLPIVEKNLSSLDSMFFAKVDLKAKTKHNFLCETYIGGGRLKNGKTALRRAYSTQEVEVFIPLRKETLLSTALIIWDFAVGREFFDSSSCSFSLAPFVGYNIDHERAQATVLGSTQQQRIATTWQGGSFGIQAAYKQHEWLLQCGYKVVIGTVDSSVFSTFIINSEIEQLTVFPKKEHRNASMLGNIMNIELYYQACDCFIYGIQGMIFYFKSKNFGDVTILEQAPTATSHLFITNARLDNIIWHQAMMLFFAEYRF